MGGRNTHRRVGSMIRVAALSGISYLALAGAVALAQPAGEATPAAPVAPAEDSGGVEEIVVTAQKRAENVQDVPIAISAVSNEYLESRGITSIDNLGSIAPNVKIERTPSNKTISQIAIRGSVTINPAITWEPAVGLYLDGVYIAKAQGSIFDIADLERVEILRGPQGTLYGRNTLAGAVNLITRKPSGEAGGEFELTYGNYGYAKGRAVLDLPQMGIFSAKISGQAQTRDGFIKIGPNPFEDDFLADLLSGPPSVNRTNDLDNYSGMLQIRAEPSDDVAIDYTYDYSRYDQRPDFSQLFQVNRNNDPRDIFDPNPANPSYSGIPLYLFADRDRQSRGSIDADPLFEKTTTQGHALTISWDVGDATIKSITAYRKLKWADSLDLDGSPMDIALTARSSRYKSFTQELQASGTALDDRLNYVVGAYYLKDKAETDNPLNFFFHTERLFSSYGSHTKAYAAYAQLDYRITDPLVLTIGGRYSHERKDIKRFFRVLATTNPAAPPAPFTAIDVGYGDVPDAKFSDFSPAATIRYEINDNINVYARYAKGFKSGGFNGETQVTEFPPSDDCPSGAPELCEPYEAEKVNSYEIGFKSRLFDNRLQLNAAAFWDKHKDIQLSVFLGEGAASVVRNAAAARIWGLEFEAIARPVEWLTVNGSAAYLNSKYKSFIDAGEEVADNRAFPHTPKYTAALGVDARVAQGNWGQLNLIGDLNHVSSYFTFPYPLRTPSESDQNAYTTKSPGRTIVNLRSALTDIPLGSGNAKGELTLWVRNLFKEDRPQNFIDFGPTFGGLTVAYYPDPRTYGVTAGIRF